MKRLDGIGRAVLLISGIILLGACTPTFNMPVSEPTVSNIKYDSQSNESHAVSITDSRNPESSFSEGRLNFNLQVEGADIQEIEYISSALEKELSHRGLPVSVSVNTNQSSVLDILTFKIINHRASGFSPLVTFTQFSGNLTVSGKTERITSFIKRGKVPAWAITEKAIIENNFNQPISLLVQDIATRIARNLGEAQISDSQVDRLSTEISNMAADDKTRYIKVYQLGFGNNIKAIPLLVSLIDDTDEYVRLAAISSLGLLQAEDEVPRLINIFNDAKLWQDRGMALKALADINNSESKVIVDQEWQRISNLESLDKESTWNKAILSLYQ